MSSRGRGYSGYNGRGGGYNSRGNGYRGSYRGGGHRGSYEGRGGRGSYYTSDTRYHSSSNPRYSSSRDRIEEPYKKSYRSDTTSYSSREYGGRTGSPERKRMRMEGSSSDRRSHDGGGHYGSSYGGGGRQESYSGERRSFSGEERRRSPAREYRKTSSGMGPPREPRMTMRSRAPRRTFRGRTMRTRGVYRGVTRIRGSFASRRYGDRALGYPRAYRTIKPRSPAKSKDEASSTEEEWDVDDKDEEVIEDAKEPKAESVVKKEAEGEASEAEADAGDATDKEPDAASDAPPPRPRQYVQLACVHCKERHATFGGYVKHLISHRHREAMNAVARRHKTQLLRMRLAQRNAQREIEAGATEEELTTRTTYCLICRLNFRTTRREHNASDTHLAMKAFLMPFCGVCRIEFRSPMIYEHHVCSLEHLKRRARNKVARRTSPKTTAAAASGDEGMDVDLDNFMTLDAVGDDVDEVEDEEISGEKKSEEKAKKPKVEINIGSEHIKKMEVLWCELCRVYLPRGEAGAEDGEAMRRHCRLRIHLSRYVQHRDTRTLRKQAERIHRQLHKQKEGEKEAAAAEAKVDEIKTEPVDEKKLENGTEEAANASDTTLPGSEDKLWADVDKDLGELLSEVDPQGQEASDDEDELNRYDRFRKTDKKTKAQAGEEAAADGANDKNEVEAEASV